MSITVDLAVSGIMETMSCGVFLFWFSFTLLVCGVMVK